MYSAITELHRQHAPVLDGYTLASRCLWMYQRIRQLVCSGCPVLSSGLKQYATPTHTPLRRPGYLQQGFIPIRRAVWLLMLVVAVLIVGYVVLSHQQDLKDNMDAYTSSLNKVHQDNQVLMEQLDQVQITNQQNVEIIAMVSKQRDSLQQKLEGMSAAMMDTIIVRPDNITDTENADRISNVIINSIWSSFKAGAGYENTTNDYHSLVKAMFAQ